MKKVLLLAVLSISATLFVRCSDDNGTKETVYTVTLTTAGSGTASASAETAPAGATVTLTATPDEGNRFTGWSVLGGNITLSDPSAVTAMFTMPESNVSVRANFENTLYGVSVIHDGNGTASADKQNPAEGEEVTITAVPNDGYAFLKWRVVSGELTLSDDTANPATFAMPAGNVEISASFVELSGQSNSYMVSPGGSVSFPVSQANRIFTEGLNASTEGLGEVTADNYTLELVWADLPVGAGGVIEEMFTHTSDGEGYIHVKTGVTGNAVIGIKLAGETVFRWSWHIWVTEPVTYATDTETGVTWMDRNLGAKANTPFVNGLLDQDQWVKTTGLYYQWGRKDAFPGTVGNDEFQTYYIGGSNTATTDEPLGGDYEDLPDLVQNPLSRTTKTDYNGSVNRSYSDNRSWGLIDGSKTIYDPCPQGWKVPSATVSGTDVWGETKNPGWESWGNKGRVFNGVDGTAGLGHYYSAAGAYINGPLIRTENEGCYWTASATGASRSTYLRFYTATVGTDPSARYSCYSVRCVRE